MDLKRRPEVVDDECESIEMFAATETTSLTMSKPAASQERAGRTQTTAVKAVTISSATTAVDDETDESPEEEVARSFAKGRCSAMTDPPEFEIVCPMIPKKSDVLHYFIRAGMFRMKYLKQDIQITDLSDSPLFDVWYEVNCCMRLWTVETFGKTVVVLHEPLSIFDPFNAESRITVNDWNGEYFGSIIPGNPFLLHDAENHLVAKLLPHPCSAEIVAPKEATNAEEVCHSGSKDKSRWHCVLEGSGTCIATVEETKTIIFKNPLTLQMKLLTMAAIIRLVAQKYQLSPLAIIVKGLVSCCLKEQ